MNKKELIESLRNEYIQGLITEDYYKGKNWGINIALGLVNQLDETKIKKERAWLNEKVYGLSETISNVDGKGEYVGISKNAVLSLIDELERPEIAEEPTFLEHLTRLFKKHGYAHLGQVALALENDLEISINKELPVIPPWVAEIIENEKYDRPMLALDKIVTGSTVFNRKKPFYQISKQFDDYRKSIGLTTDEAIKNVMCAISSGYAIAPHKKYRVKVSEELYFVRYDELEIIVIRDNAPGFIERAKVFDNKEEAEKVADDVNGYLEELPEDEAMKLIEGWKEE